MTKKCKHCGREFEPQHYLEKYCSDECRTEFYRQYRRAWRRKDYTYKNPKLITCPICGKTFLRTEGKQKYCSPECVEEAHRRIARESNRLRRIQKKVDACKTQHGNCFNCDMSVGVCRYD